MNHSVPSSNGTLKLRMYWKLILFTLLLCLISTGESINCPIYCRCFTGVKFLRNIKCVNQQLIDIDIDMPEAVQVLDVSNNSLSYLENGCFKRAGLLQLVEIDLKYNTLVYIDPKSFDGLDLLQRLDLRGNHLHKIFQDTFNENLNLIHLVLAENPLNSLITKHLLAAPSVQFLDISQCRFGHLSTGIFNGLPKLRSLDLSGNQLITLNKEVFESLLNLESIDISQTQIECDSAFKDLLDWMNNRTIQVSGSLCKDDVEEFQPAPYMFQKMVMELEDTIKENEENVDYWLYDEKYLQDKLKSGKCKERNVTLVQCYKCDNLIIPQFWVFIIGLEIGIIFTMIGSFVWCMCDRTVYNKHERQFLLKSQPESILNLSVDPLKSNALNIH